MTKTYPDTIPHPFNDNDDLSRAYRMGWNHGHGIACHNVPTLGDKLWTESMGHVTVDAENIREVHQDECFAAEENSRCYSPFEFTAHEFNSAGDGGFRICYDHDDMSDETYDTREEAEAAAVTQGWGGTEIIEVQAAEDLWSAFEQGTSDAIIADLESYTDEHYGIEDEGVDRA